MGILFFLFFAVFGILLFGMLINIAVECAVDGTGVGCVVMLLIVLGIAALIFGH